MHTILDSYTYKCETSLFLNHSCIYLLKSLYQRTPLHIAAREGYLNTARNLVNQGADIKIKDVTGVCVRDYSTVRRLVLLIRAN